MTPGPKRRWFHWSIAAIVVTASFAVGWVAGRAHLRHQQDMLLEAGDDDDPFAARGNTSGKDLLKDYLIVPEEMDYQTNQPPLGVERPGLR